MTTGQLVVIGLRLVVPLLILRGPLAGGIAAVLLDAPGESSRGFASTPGAGA